MTTTDQPKAAFFRKLRGVARRGEGAVATAFLVADPPAVPVRSVRVSWGQRTRELLTEVARQAKEADRASGRALPYASLRSALQVVLPEATLVNYDLGAPWTGGARTADASALLLADGTAEQVVGRVRGAFATWQAMVLTPWAERLSLGDALLDALADEIETGNGLSADVVSCELGEALRRGEPFSRLKHPIIQLLSRALEGAELFEGLGPVFRIVPSGSSGNAVQFETWPVPTEGGPYSMTATFSVETAPWCSRPIVVVEAGRRPWMPDLPRPSALMRQRELRGHILGRDRSPVAVEFSCAVCRGEVQEPFSPAFMQQALGVRADLAAGVAELARRGLADGGTFVGFPYATRYGSHHVKLGASTRDLLDLFDAAEARLAPLGMTPLTFEDIGTPPRRSDAFHKAVSLGMVIGDVARTLGHNEIGERAVAEACAALGGDGPMPKGLKDEDVRRVEADRDALRTANSARIRRSFDAAPILVLMARTERERSAMASCVRALFGASVRTVPMALPADVHGARQGLPEADRKAAERFAARIAAWKPTAQALAEEHAGCHVLVQATDWYENRPDDPVNKLAGRCALATEANANAQYLLPPGPGWRGFEAYLNRIQAAIYDLVFGHSGLVTEISDLVAKHFPDPATRPRSVMGISVVTQARGRAGGRGSKLCVATRIDVVTGRTEGRLGWVDAKRMRWSGSWRPFSELLKEVAEIRPTSLGKDREAESESFQSFVRAMLDEAAAAGDRPLVLIDSTSASGVWPWLRDDKIGKEVALARETFDATKRWPGVRIVRVRTGHAGRVVLRKTTRLEELDAADGKPTGRTLERPVPTITARMVRIGDGPHYWATSGYLEQLTRGLSVYRETRSTARLKGAALPVWAAIKDARTNDVLGEAVFNLTETPYRLPNSVEFSVAVLAKSDDPDAVAAVANSLRFGYGHTPSFTTLPAPLSFESKVRDYMARFGVEEADAEDSGASPPDDAAEALDAGTVAGDPAGDNPPDLARADLASDTAPPRELPPSKEHAASTAASPFLQALDPAYREPLDRKVGIRLLSPINETFVASVSAAATQDEGAPRYAADGLPELPAFLDLDWVLSNMSAQPRTIRLMHERRAMFLSEKPELPWPNDRRPTNEEFAAVVLHGFRQPWTFVHIESAWRKATGRDKGVSELFKSLLDRARREAARIRASRRATFADDMRTLVEAGQVDLARSTVVAWGVYVLQFETAISLARDLPELRDLLPYLLAAQKTFEAPPGGRTDKGSAETISLDEQAPSLPLQNDPAIEPSGGHGGDQIPGEEQMLEKVVQQTVGDTHAGLVPPSGPTDSGEQGASVARWSDSMSAIAKLASEAAILDPNPVVLQRIADAVSRAEQALAAFEAARPKVVRVDELLHRLREIARNAADMLKQSEAEAAIPEEGLLVLETGIGAIQEALAAAEASLARAVELKADAEARARNLDPLDGAAIDALRQISDSVRKQASECLERVAHVSALLLATRAPQTSGPPNAPAPNVQDDPPTGTLGQLEAGPDAVVTAVVGDAATPRVPSLEWAEISDQDETSPPDEKADEGGDDGPITALSNAGSASTNSDGDVLTEADATELGALLTGDMPSDEVATAEPASEETDDEAVEADRLVVSAFRGGDPSLAWLCLRAATEVFPGHAFQLSVAELRLAAVAGHLNHAALQASDILGETLADALAAATAIPDGDPVLSAQRALSMFVAALEPALFQQNRTAVELLEAAHEGLPDPLKGGTFRLREAVAKATRSNLVVTPALLRIVNDLDALDRDREGRKGAIQAKIDTITRLDFPFVTGVKVRVELCKPEEAIGALRVAMAENGQRALDAARAFREEVGSRQQALRLVGKMTERVSPKDTLDGPARDRLVGHMLDLARLCAEYEEALAVAPAVRNPRQKEIAKELRSSLLVGIEHALAALSSDGQDLGPCAGLVGRCEAAVVHLRGMIDETAAVPGPTDHLFALHSATLLLPSLDIGRGWLPEPYDPNAILAASYRAEASLLPDGERRAERFTEIVRTRMARGSFGGAEVLMQAAPVLGVSGDAIDELRHEWEADAPTRRDALREHASKARRLVERVQRYGEGMSPEEAHGLLSQIDSVQAADLPSLVSPEERSEILDDRAHVHDFSSAEALLDEICIKARAALSGPRKGMDERLEGLRAKGVLTPEVDRSLRTLLDEHDDLITARERIELLEAGQPLPRASAPANRRWAAFFPRVPDFLAKLPEAESRDLPRRIEEGTDVGPLAFSRVTPGRRPGAARTLKAWRDLHRALKAQRAPDTVLPIAMGLLEEFGFAVESMQLDAKNSKAGRQVVADAKLRFSLDPESMLLPDFGSRTEGAYRVCFLPSIPNDAEITALSSNMGNRAALIFATDTMGAENRRALALRSVSAQGGRKALVVDDAVVLFALSEPEVRPLTLIECAQPFAHCQPFGDYGRYSGVPREMFFGRNAEYGRLLDGFGSCVVYGGRRLGKTALLKHIEAREHRPSDGVVVAHVALDDFGANRPRRAREVWRKISERLSPTVFREPTASRDEFDRKVRGWLGADPMRRILLLLDEADKFVEEDATGDSAFQEFRALQSLMDETNRRFKFVMAGLHNVTRLVQAENSPLRQIAAEPQRIGPLMGGEVADAEALIVKPLAAMGYRFENREDVWTVLSHTNYYPVLAQTFCASLVDELAREAAQRREVTWTVSSETVRRVLDSRPVKDSIKEKFEHTIKELDPRYELITYVMADRSLRERAEGLVGEGMTAAEIRDAAVRYWPKAGDRVSRLPVIEALLDEMEGLGVVRRARGDRWALRSPSVLALLGTRDRVGDHLREFEDKEPQRAFEPRSLRRQLSSTHLGIDAGQYSPLTFGQEQDILSGEAPVRIVLGLPLSDVDLVGAALQQAASDGDGTRRWTVDIGNRSQSELLAHLRTPRASQGSAQPLVVVGPRADWTPEWVLETLKSKSVRERLARVVFVGSGVHAVRLFSDARFASPPPSIRTITLQPWTTSAIEELAMNLGVGAAEIRAPLIEQLGGFNRPIWRAVKLVRASQHGKAAERIVERIRREAEGIRPTVTLDDFSLPAPILDLVPGMVSLSGASGSTSPYEIEEGVLSGRDVGSPIDAKTVVRICVALSLLEPLPHVEGTEEDMRQYRLNPLIVAAAAEREAAA